MDSYRDSTSVGLRLASTLSSDRGQQQSNNIHVFAIMKYKRKIEEFNGSVHYKINTDICLFYWDFRFLNSCSSTSRPDVKEDHYNCSQKWSMCVTFKINEFIELDRYYDFI